MSAPWYEQEELVDLLAKEATEGLSDSERARLDVLTASLPDAERDDLQLAAAAINLAAYDASEPLPAAVRERVLADIPASPAVAGTEAPTRLPIERQRRSPARSPSAAGWWAAAACLVLAVAGWWPRITDLRGDGDGDGNSAGAGDSAGAQREELLAGTGTVSASWTPGPQASAAGLTGDVVFDPATQRGYLRFRGLPPNDRSTMQYQLWIVDASRTQPEPVDGGVFDVAADATGEVLIPFRPRLDIGRPAAFVVTAEVPGGVVVSRQERVFAVAKVEPAAALVPYSLRSVIASSLLPSGSRTNAP